MCQSQSDESYKQAGGVSCIELQKGYELFSNETVAACGLPIPNKLCDK